MPELPEIEVFEQYVDSTSLHQTIRSVETDGQRLFKTPQRTVCPTGKGYQYDESAGSFTRKICRRTSD